MNHVKHEILCYSFFQFQLQLIIWRLLQHTQKGFCLSKKATRNFSILMMKINKIEERKTVYLPKIFMNLISTFPRDMLLKSFDGKLKTSLKENSGERLEETQLIKANRVVLLKNKCFLVYWNHNKYFTWKPKNRSLQICAGKECDVRLQVQGATDDAE